ncbi:MAG: DUF1553 domain-containing protein, partial [Phycisphaerales bacterium]
FAEGGMRGPQQDRIFNLMASAADNHRSVYLPILRDRVPESLEVFDFAEPAFVTGQRDATNVPTQALYLLNSAEVTRIADAFARRVMQAGNAEADRIEAAFATAFGRKPSASEIRACRDFLDDFTKAYAKDNAPSRDAAPRAGTLRERARQRIQQAAAQRMNQTPAQVSPDVAAYSALCQALLLSAEFRTVD